ncbi:hypothetical protein Mal65_30160 [Crateriforma conspicua]|nr:hypothetical protein Mal65_30160 [Crateriforma conspicua]
MFFRHSLVLLIHFSVSFHICFAEAAEVVVVELRKLGDGSYAGEGHVPAVRVGTPTSVTLRVKNPTGSEVAFGEPSTSCKCVEVEKSVTHISPGGQGDFRVNIAVPRRHNREQIVQFVNYLPSDAGGDAVRISLQCKVEALLATPSESIVIEADETSKMFEGRVPIRFTSPVTAKLIKAKVLAEHHGLSVRVGPKTSDGEVYLEIEMPTKDVDSSRTIPIQIFDAKNNVSRELSVILAKSRAIRVVPSSLRILRTQDGVYYARFMVIRQNNPRDSDANFQSGRALVEATLDGKQLVVKQLAVQPLLLRCELRIPSELAEAIAVSDSKNLILLSINWGNEKLTESLEIVASADVQ